MIVVQIPCINMCCPHGHAYLGNTGECKKVEGGLSYNPVLWDHKDKVFLDNWKKDKNFLIVGPEEGRTFKCPKVQDTRSAAIFQGNISGNYRILMNGQLQRQDTFPRVDEENATRYITQRWSSDNFCVIYTKPKDFLKGNIHQ